MQQENGAANESLPAYSCEIVGPLPPCTIVIFGASGDLTGKKLIPALFNMFVKKSMPLLFNIVGCARTPYSNEEFREALLATQVKSDKEINHAWYQFSRNIYYHQVSYENLESYIDLAVFLKQLDERSQTEANRIFDLAVPPHLYPVISRMIGKAGLSSEKEHGRGWSRIIIEKPFGRDLSSAQQLQNVLQQDFNEDQIFRIDHYLAKETVQNILTFRFANAIFEPLWNRRYIDYVGVVAAEEVGVENRAGYYEEAGVIRDMFQNHMLQLLALTAMEPPSHFEADKVRDEKTKVFQSLRRFSDKSDENLVLGQYGAGQINGSPVAGYRQEPGVKSDSLTPTFAMMRLFVDNWRWHGVPFYLISGKRLARKETRVIIQFKEVPHTMFQGVVRGPIAPNCLILGVYPEEEIRLTFLTKSPGAKICLSSMSLDFKYMENYNLPTLEAYEKVLLDCILGDHMLFWRKDGVELSWSLFTPMLDDCELCRNREQNLHIYPAGSWGPEACGKWLDWYNWVN